MSKKIEAIAKQVFYAQQNPKDLATLIAGLVQDVVTSVTISGEKSIQVPESDSVTSDYTTMAFSQYGDSVSDEVTLALNAEVVGVSIEDGTVTVASTAVAESFVLKATCGTVTTLMEVTLVPVPAE